MANKYFRAETGDDEQRRFISRCVILGVLLLITVIFAVASCEAKREVELPETELRMTVAGIETYPKIVDNEHLLPVGFSPSDLVALNGIPNGDSVLLREDVAAAYRTLHAAMASDGLSVLPLSGYRSYSAQQEFFDYNVEVHIGEGLTRSEAIELTDTVVERAGASEHQLGVSIDVTTDGTLQGDFGSTEQGRWLLRNSWRYGFIVRYTAGKAELTGRSAEPWHLRYVGVSHAKYMHDYGLCLEEYVKYCIEECPDAVEED